MRMATPHNRPMRATLMRVATAGALLLALVGWAVSSPIGASPDDDYHLATIWCSEFSPLHPCTQVPAEEGGASYLVPAVLIESHVCFAFQPESTADCADNVSESLRLTDRINQTQGLYPGGFYTAMSIFASSDFTRSVSMMRVSNALLAASLLAAFLFLGAATIRRSALLALPVIFIPLGVFLFASTNPSSWTVIGSIFYFLFGLTAFFGRAGRGRYVASLLLAVLAAALALMSRVDGSVFIVVITLAIVVLASGGHLQRAKAATITVISVGIAGSITFWLQGLGPAGSESTIGESRYVGGLFLTNLLEIPSFLGGAVGAAPLGWGDTPMPGLVLTVGLFSVGGIAIWGLSVVDLRKALTLVGLAVTAFGLPVALAQQQRIDVLDFVQARYLLPLIAVLVLTLALTLPPARREPMQAVPHYTLAVLVSLSGAVALWANYHRYAYGAQEPLLARNLEPAWPGLWGPSSLAFIIVGMIATVAFVMLMAVQYRHMKYGADNEASTEGRVLS